MSPDASYYYHSLAFSLVMCACETHIEPRSIEGDCVLCLVRC